MGIKTTTQSLTIEASAGDLHFTATVEAAPTPPGAITTKIEVYLSNATVSSAGIMAGKLDEDALLELEQTASALRRAIANARGALKADTDSGQRV